MKIVMVEWIDAFGCPAGWQFEDEAELEATSVTSIGYVINKTKKFLMVAPHVSTPGGGKRRQLAGHIAIPRRQITSIKTLISC